MALLTIPQTRLTAIAVFLLPFPNVPNYIINPYCSLISFAKILSSFSVICLLCFPSMQLPFVNANRRYRANVSPSHLG